MKKVIFITMAMIFICCSNNHAQCEIKTLERPDGRTLKYFNPKPIIRNINYEVGVSIYRDMTANFYMISISVLFKDQNPIELTGNLILQTTGDYGLRLKPIGFDQITMNGELLSVGMYKLESRDVSELGKHELKSVFFHLLGELKGSTVTENSNIIKNQFKCLE